MPARICGTRRSLELSSTKHGTYTLHVGEEDNLFWISYLSLNIRNHRPIWKATFGNVNIRAANHMRQEDSVIQLKQLLQQRDGMATVATLCTRSWVKLTAWLTFAPSDYPKSRMKICCWKNFNPA